MMASQNVTILFQKISSLYQHIHIIYSMLYQRKRNEISGSQSQCSEGQCYIAIVHCYNIVRKDSLLWMTSSQNLTILLQKLSFLYQIIHILHSVLYRGVIDDISGSEAQSSNGQC